MFKQFAAIGILLFACSQLGNAIKCYDCRETNIFSSLMNDPNCKDPFQNKSKITVCPADRPYCGKLKVDENDATLTSRRCETENGCNGIGRQYCSLCSTDLCNSAFNIAAPSINFAVLFACVFYLL